MNFKNDAAIIPVGNTYQLTPIVDYSSEKKYATFLFSTVSNNDSSNSILKLELWNDELSYLSRLVDLSSCATVEQLNGKQNILTKTELSDGSVDWNTLIDTAIYPITIPQGFTDDFTHGLEGIGGYGTLIVLGDNRHTGCYQIYINDEYNIYLRSYYSDSRGWRNWKRIDAGAGVTLKPGISDPTIDWNTITESGLYTIGHDGKITADSHGPLGVTGWGLLTVINTGLGSANPACIRQVCRH